MPLDFPFQVFLCLLFGVVCVVFIVWMLRQNSETGFITTTEYTVPVAQAGETVSQPPAYSPPFGDINFTNMRLLVYYARIAVRASIGPGKPDVLNIPEVREKAVETVLAFCQVDGYEIDEPTRAAVPTVVDYAINESLEPLF